MTCLPPDGEFLAGPACGGNTPYKGEARPAGEPFPIGVARRQGAKSLELQAALSLGRLWQQQGKGEEAHHLLAEIYGWFTERLETADLKKAKALLDELS